MTLSSVRQFAVGACAAVGLVAGAAVGAARADLLDDIGYRALVSRKGSVQTSGSGVPVAQVEVFEAGTTAYVPNRADDQFAGKQFTVKSGTSGGASGHATMVARHFYGTQDSAAGGVSAVTLYSADGFVGGVLRTGNKARAPGGAGAGVINNSWVAAYTNDATNVDAVRRLDDLIVRDDVLVFSAVENGNDGTFPRLLAGSFNGVAVGTRTGSRGPVVFDGPGARIKPDLIVDTQFTSVASATAAGAGALLRAEAATRRMTAAGQLAIKTILMAGADRDDTWHRGRSSGADNATAPLDFQQGAGRLRVDRAFDILTAGRQARGTTVDVAAGWDAARTPRGGGEASYLVHAGATLPKWDVFLSWDRVVTGLVDGKYDSTTTMADFALSLYRNRKGGRRLVATSDSKYDNVESLQLTDLPAGDYSLVVSAGGKGDYALAWCTDDAGDVASHAHEGGPGGGAGPVTVDGGGAWGTSVPEPCGAVAVAVAALLTRRRPARRPV